MSGRRPHALDGHVPATDPLSTRRAFKAIAGATRHVVRYKVEALWRRDTRSLPPALEAARRRIRAFAERELAPLSLRLDTAPHRPGGELAPEVAALLVKAGRAGLLTDVLPRPLGSGPLRSFRYPFAWYQAVRIEELSCVCGGLMLLLSAPSLGVAPIILSGDLAAIRRFVLPAFRRTKRGDPHLFAFAITEPAAGSDVEDGHGASRHTPGVVARRVTGGWSLRGRKCFISGGDIAESFTVFAALKGEGMASWTCFLVKRSMPGLRIARTELKMGMRASGAAELELDDVVVPDEHVIAGLRKGWALNRASLNASRIPVAAMAVGLARAATEAAITFACRVRLGGKEIIHFQEVQLMVAQMVADTATIRSLVWQTASTSRAPRQDLAAICKFQSTDTAVRVAETAMDLMSNHGMLYTNRAEKVFRDARLTQIFEGTNQINRLAVIEDQQEQFLEEIGRSQG